MSDFNPRSREGSDAEYSPIFSVVSNFNPRSREGSDIDHAQEYINLTISIHAPVKGATIAQCIFIIPCTHFNPRSREGSDLSFHG